MKPAEEEVDEIEETFAYGRTRAERGAARFKSEEAMWRFMKKNAGKHQHTYNEHESIVMWPQVQEREQRRKQKTRQCARWCDLSSRGMVETAFQ